jgi:ABC-type sulfate transport system permease subunit
LGYQHTVALRLPVNAKFILINTITHMLRLWKISDELFVGSGLLEDVVDVPFLC